MTFIAYFALAVFGAMGLCLALAESMRYAKRLFLSFRAKNRFAALLLAAAILGFGYSFATKPENRAGSVPSPRHVPAPYGIVVLDGCDSPGFDLPTNLCISGFSALSNSVLLSMAWPDDMQPDYLDLYSSTNLRTWSRLATVNVMDCASNATVEISSFVPARFFTVADQSDQDLDGLTDAEERLVYGTDPMLADTDADGMADGDEIVAGCDPGNEDTDGDGLIDSEEFCRIETGTNFPSFNASWSLLRSSGANDPNRSIVALPFAKTLAGMAVSHAMVDVNGVVRFGNSETTNQTMAISIPADLAHGQNFADVVVAPFWTQLALSERVDSSIRAAGVFIGGQRYFVIEYANMAIDPHAFGVAGFQIAIPEFTPADTVFVRYNGMSIPDFLAGNLVAIGAQGAGNGFMLPYYHGSVCGSVTNGTTLAYRFNSGLCALNADSDGDGLPDGWEVAHGMDPLYDGGLQGPVGDLDADGLSNLEEYNMGTDPRSMDTDGDGMNDGWEAGYGLDPLSGDSLLDPDGDGLGNGEECLLRTNPALADTDCDGLTDGQEAVFGTNPTQPDSDLDGMNDGWEQQYAGDGFDPVVNNATDNNPDNDLNADPDGDGLTNQQEAEAGTSPTNSDTDGDGLTDGVEVGQGSDPNDRADTIPVKWVSVTGGLEMEQIKQAQETVTIPAGAMAYIGVFVHSQECPDWTGQQSQYNDVLYWNIQADGQTTLRNTIHVNAEEISWENAALQGWSVNGFTPVAHKGGAIYRAGGSDLNVAVTLRAMNVRDDILPSSVIVGVFPLKVVQANMPTATGVANTTDAATSYFRTLIPTNGVAYITAEPAAPQLTAQFKDLPQWITATWSMTLTTERSNHRFDGIDNRTLQQVTRRGSEVYDITSELQNEIIGGACALNIRIGDAAMITYPFSIRGKNPPDSAARAYIDANVDADFTSYAWKIAKHESKEGIGRVYNQFNASENQYKELPNWGTPHGWGI